MSLGGIQSSISCNSLSSERIEVKLVSMEPERYFLNVYTKTVFDYGQNNLFKPSNLSNGIFLRDA